MVDVYTFLSCFWNLITLKFSITQRTGIKICRCPSFLYLVPSGTVKHETLLEVYHGRPLGILILLPISTSVTQFRKRLKRVTQECFYDAPTTKYLIGPTMSPSVTPHLITVHLIHRLDPRIVSVRAQSPGKEEVSKQVHK